MDKTQWIAFFSQTGSEIADISKSLGRWPDIIITNERPEHLRTVDERVEKQGYFTWANKPTLEDYAELLMYHPHSLITLHGWLRVVPPEICERHKIYNGHPGLITRYPELKGKDPQIRAFKGNYRTGGCVIHEVTAGVDEGKILLKEEINIENLDLEGLFNTLRDRSLYLWCKLFKQKLWKEELQ